MLRAVPQVLNFEACVLGLAATRLHSCLLLSRTDKGAIGFVHIGRFILYQKPICSARSICIIRLGVAVKADGKKANAINSLGGV